MRVSEETTQVRGVWRRSLELHTHTHTQIAHFTTHHTLEQERPQLVAAFTVLAHSAPLRVLVDAAARACPQATVCVTQSHDHTRTHTPARDCQSEERLQPNKSLLTTINATTSRTNNNSSPPSFKTRRRTQCRQSPTGHQTTRLLLLALLSVVPPRGHLCSYLCPYWIASSQHPLAAAGCARTRGRRAVGARLGASRSAASA